MSNPITWVSDRFKERTSWNGIIIGGAALLVIFGIVPLAKMVIWGALAWGAYNLWKAE